MHSTTICIAWKSEHAGVAGYLAYRSGEETDNVTSSGGDYLLLPSRGVESVSGGAMALTDEQRLMFPELLLDGRERCYLLGSRSGDLVPSAPGTVTQLLEADLDVEPVLPVEM